jgi:hypothetical protein
MSATNDRSVEPRALRLDSPLLTSPSKPPSS